MNRAKDGYVHRRTDGAGKRRIGVCFRGRSLACAIAATSLLKVFGSAPQACGAQCDTQLFAHLMSCVAADPVMSRASREARDHELPPPNGPLAAGCTLALADDLEPVTPESMGLAPWSDAVPVLETRDVPCELRELEGMLAMLDDERASHDGIPPVPMSVVVDGPSRADDAPVESVAPTNDCDDSSPCDESGAEIVATMDVVDEPSQAESPTVPLPEAVAAGPSLEDFLPLPLPLFAVFDGEAGADHAPVNSIVQSPGVQSNDCDESVPCEESDVEKTANVEIVDEPSQLESPANPMRGAVAAGPDVDEILPLPMFAILEREAGVNTAPSESIAQEKERGDSVQEEAPEKDVTVASEDSGAKEVSDAQEESSTQEESVAEEAGANEAESDPPPSEPPAIPMHQTTVQQPTLAASPVTNGDIVAGVSILSESAQRITVGRNSSAAIDLKMDCDRAEIADPAVADIVVVSPKRLIVSGKAFGTTQMILRVGQQQKVFTVAVEQDLSLLAGIIRSVSPTANVQPRSVNGTIVLGGTVPDAQTGDRIAEMASLFQGGPVRNQLTVAGVQQTMLRVVVAEVNKEAVRQLGFNWAIGGADWTRDFFFANNVSGLNPTVFSSNGSTNIGGSPTPQITYSVAPTGNTAATNLTFGFPRAEFQVFMQALRQNSLARVLAEPNLVAISGQTATFLAGGEVPIPVTQGGAVAGSITIEYKEFGVRLAFTPTVLAGQIIRLHVMSEVSDAVPGDTIAGGLPVFSFNTRRVESTVECGNGQTFAMAGLLNETVQAVARKLPGLGDVPVLGALFSSVEYQKNNTELVVLVTPQLVEPLDPQQVPPPPGSLMTAPNDYELFALGQLEGTPNEAPSTEPDSSGHPSGKMTPVSMNGRPTSQYALRGPWGLADTEEN